MHAISFPCQQRINCLVYGFVHFGTNDCHFVRVAFLWIDFAKKIRKGLDTPGALQRKLLANWNISIFFFLLVGGGRLPYIVFVFLLHFPEC